MTLKGLVGHQTLSLRGARSATKQSPSRDGADGPNDKVAVWRNEPENSNNFNDEPGMTMAKFAHLALHVMPGLDPGIHEAVRRRKPYVVGASPWMTGSSPAMPNVRFGSARLRI